MLISFEIGRVRSHPIYLFILFANEMSEEIVSFLRIVD